MFEKALGADNPELVETLKNLAGLYKDQGRLNEAAPLLKRAAAIRAKAAGIKI